MSVSTEAVSFLSKSIKLVGTLYLPAGFNAEGTTKYDAVVMTPPAHQIKEQTLANYGPKLAQKGFVAFAFDYNSKGESDSYSDKFRNDEQFPRKWEDLRNAISFLRSKSYVKNLFALGICGGGNIMSSVIITDLRVKAFASVSAMMASDMINFGSVEGFKAMVTAANEARQKMFETGEPTSIDLFGYEDPDYLEKNPNVSDGRKEGYDYYGTKRAGAATYPRFSNHVLGSIWESATLNLGEQYADKVIQPYLAIVGSKAETAMATKLYYDKVTSEKEYFEVEGASHVDLYDKDVYIDKAVDKIADFFNKYSK